MKVKDLKLYRGMLIIVDMVNGFVKTGDLADPKIGKIVPRRGMITHSNYLKNIMNPFSSSCII